MEGIYGGKWIVAVGKNFSMQIYEEGFLSIMISSNKIIIFKLPTATK
jgi:hypothetical protein